MILVLKSLFQSLTIALFSLFSLAAAAFILFFYFGKDLPDHQYLKDYRPPLVNRAFTSEGDLLFEYAQERRIFLSLEKMPILLIQAFLMAEDKNFFFHNGIDLERLLKAAFMNSIQQSWAKHPIGASTISQQVAKNFLIGNERSFSRKAKEAIMAFRLEQTLGKSRILELYLNQIYLGRNTYGVAAAAVNYFGKNIYQLQLHEMAFLAALPKAPSALEKEESLKKAKDRRDWVLSRMAQEGIISPQDQETASNTPIELINKSGSIKDPGFFSDEVQRQTLQIKGLQEFKSQGISIHTTIDSTLQKIAQKALQHGLELYDRRHGWRGPYQGLHFEDLDEEASIEKIKGLHLPLSNTQLQLAIVTELNEKEANILLKDGTHGTIPLKEMLWARRYISVNSLGPEITKPSDVLKKGDVILVSLLEEKNYRLTQIPEVSGGLVILDPYTGRVFALTGGYDYKLNQFNCASQGLRQPGSAFKPFVYFTALEKGYTAESIILDAPIEIYMGRGVGAYAPRNISRRFYGPTPLAHGIIYSRNAMTVRLAQKVGLKSIKKVVSRFGLTDSLPLRPSIALGSYETTLLKLTAAYAPFANGGYKITPSVIDKIYDSLGGIIWHHEVDFFSEKLPITHFHHIAIMREILKMVVEKGTAKQLKYLTQYTSLSGKTGSANDYRDAWFIGYTDRYVIGAFVGFHDRRSLGESETGGKAALPLFEKCIISLLELEGKSPHKEV